MQTHLVYKIMHQNLAVTLWQLNYSKKSFIQLGLKWPCYCCHVHSADHFPFLVFLTSIAMEETKIGTSLLTHSFISSYVRMWICKLGDCANPT